MNLVLLKGSALKLGGKIFKDRFREERIKRTLINVEKRMQVKVAIAVILPEVQCFLLPYG